MKYYSQLITFRYKKGDISIKNIRIETHACKEIAQAHIYNTTGMAYGREEKGSVFTLCNFQFGWIPTYITVAIVSPLRRGEFYLSYSLQDKYHRRTIKDFLDGLIKINQDRDWGSIESKYPDVSLKLSQWAWKYTIPKGYELLRPGDIVLESDREYNDISSRNKCWGNVSWYNVGKTVEKGCTWCHIDKDGKKVDEGTYEPRPLICRKSPVKI